jgi:radical SAM protein with 4Fe4S-binding SPASM domain
MSIKQRLNGITKIDEVRLSIKPPVPRSVKIELTSVCNYRCKFCGLYSRKSAPKDMDFNLFKRITKEMAGLGVSEIGLFYIGESFTNFSLLLKAIKYLKSELKIPYVFLTSNGSLAQPKRVKECMEAGLDSLKWSCNAMDGKQFTEITGVDEKFFNASLKNIREIWNIRQNSSLSTKLYASSIKYSDEHLFKMNKWAQDNIVPYVDEYYWLPLYSAGGQATTTEKSLGMKPTAGNTGRLDDPSEPLPCWTLFTEGHIMVDGKMTGCCLDGIGNWVMGDLTEQTFMEAWHSKDFQELRKAHLKKDVRKTKCAKCVLY